jgi:hypothetical protein
MAAIKITPVPTFYVPDVLFSVDTNAKTVKGQKYGFLTAVLYLAPADLASTPERKINLCSMAELAKCKDPCLFTAGRAAFTPSIIRARINKTHYFLFDRAAFMKHAVREIRKLIRRAQRMGLTLLVRMNGTSDIHWESIALTVDGVDYANIMEVFPDVQFYDYSKIPARFAPSHELPKNYDLTFSYSGVSQFQKYVERAKDAGARMAVVFSDRNRMPQTFDGMTVVDGDDSDIRHLDPKGSTVALYAKGRAKKDRSGFVVQV